MNAFPPLSWARSVVEWLGEKPKYQWTLGSNPLLGKKSYCTLPLSRGARLWERGVMLAIGITALMGAPHSLAMLGLGITGNPLNLATAGMALFNLKANSICMGVIMQGVTMGTRFVVQAFDQIVNGPDEFRESEKYAKQIKKMEVKQGGLRPSSSPVLTTDSKPSIMDKWKAIGEQFNGRAGQQTAAQQLQNTVIWGDNSTTGAPQPGNGQKYEEAFQVPSEDTVRVASSGREGAWQHNHHVGSSAPHPTHPHNNGGDGPG